MNSTVKRDYIFFDFGGTVADSRRQALEIFQTLARLFRLDREVVRRVMASGNLDVKTIVHEFGLSRPLLMLMAIPAKILMHRKAISPVGGIAEALDVIRARGARLGIMSSDAARVIRKLLKEWDLAVFDTVITDLFDKEREIPLVLKERGIAIERVIYVGDESRDIEACRSAGIPVVAVTWGFCSRFFLASFNPDRIVDDPADLVRAIADLERGP